MMSLRIRRIGAYAHKALRFKFGASCFRLWGCAKAAEGCPRRTCRGSDTCAAILTKLHFQPSKLMYGVFDISESCVNIGKQPVESCGRWGCGSWRGEFLQNVYSIYIIYVHTHTYIQTDRHTHIRPFCTYTSLLRSLCERSGLLAWSRVLLWAVSCTQRPCLGGQNSDLSNTI